MKPSLDTLSRLKGIETYIYYDHCFRVQFLPSFGYAFPFEGNWNSLHNTRWILAYMCLWIRFPVWRELKRTWGEGRLLLRDFGYAFPFEGNWNPSPLEQENTLAKVFGYAFPFEGNWNTVSLKYRAIHLFDSLDTLSRLKGIETNRVCWARNRECPLDTLSRLKGIETMKW